MMQWTSLSSGSQNFFLQKVIHKTFLEKVILKTCVTVDIIYLYGTDEKYFSGIVEAGTNLTVPSGFLKL